MRDEDHVADSHTRGEDGAAYVLGALAAAELEAFERHLHSCIVCRDEVSAFQQVADALPMAPPQHDIPRGLRRRVLRAVRAEPRLQSVTRRQRPHLSGALLPPRALAFATLLLASLTTVGGLELVAGGPDSTRVIHASVIGSRATAEVRLAGGHAELVVRHLPPPAFGRIYEVWLGHGRSAPSPTSALFTVTAAGAGDVAVPGDLRGVSAVMVTEEPAGGSEEPTHAPVILAHLT